MSVFPHTNVGSQIAEATGQLAPDDAAYGWAHAILCEALSKPFEQVAELIDPPEPYPPWGPLFDVSVCPDWALPWLAQLVGVRVPPGYSQVDLRTLIDSVAGFKIGSPAALRAAAQPFLTGTKTIYFRERDGDPYILDVVVLEGETVTENLVPNPKFRENADFWYNIDWGFMSLVPNDDLLNDSCLSVNAFPTAGQAIEVRSQPPDFADKRIKNGDKIRVGGSIRIDPNTQPITANTYYGLAVALRQSDGSLVTGDYQWVVHLNNPNTPTNQWIDMEALIEVGSPPFAPDSDPETIEVGIFCYNGSGGTTPMWFRMSKLWATIEETGSVKSSYADGDTAGWEWEGEPHASYSIHDTYEEIQAALLAVKPAGIKMTFRKVVGWDWQQVVVEVPTWGDLVANFDTWGDAMIKEQ